MPRTLSLVLPCALALAACSWSVPADPGLNEARRATRAAPASGEGVTPPRGRALARPGADDEVGRGLFVGHCGRCHALPSPRHAAPEAWPGIVQRMGPRAGLFGADRQRVLGWLVANAR